MVAMVWGYRVPEDTRHSSWSNRLASEFEECMWAVLDEVSELGFNRQVPLSEWRGDESDRCA